MSASKIFGVVMLGSGAFFLMWRAHKQGMLRPLLTGGLYGGSIAVFVYFAMSLILGGQ
jgi:hypothetical protein